MLGVIDEQAGCLVLIRPLLVEVFAGTGLHLGEEVFRESLDLVEDVIVAAAAQAAKVGQGDDAGGEPLGAEPEQAGGVHQEKKNYKKI